MALTELAESLYAAFYGAERPNHRNSYLGAL